MPQRQSQQLIMEVASNDGRARRRKSSRSGTTGGNCVEVATNRPGNVYVRQQGPRRGCALSRKVMDFIKTVRDNY